MIRRLRTTVAIAAAAAMLLTMAMATPALGKGPAPKTISFTSSEYFLWEGLPTGKSVGIGLERSVTKGTPPSVTVTIGKVGDTASATDYSVAETTFTVTFTRSQQTISQAAIITALSEGALGESDERITLTLSNPSSKWSVGADATVTIHEEPAPPAPIDMGATPLGTSTLDVGWSMPSYLPTNYPLDYPLTFKVDRSTDGSIWTEGVYEGAQYWFYDEGLEAATTYTYHVHVTNAEGATDVSDNFTGTTGMPPPTPTCWAEQDYDDPTVVHVTWTIKDDYVGDPVYFHVQSSSDSGETWTWVTSTWEYSADDTGLAVIPDYYRVDAQTDNGTVESAPCSWGS